MNDKQIRRIKEKLVPNDTVIKSLQKNVKSTEREKSYPFKMAFLLSFIVIIIFIVGISLKQSVIPEKKNLYSNLTGLPSESYVLSKENQSFDRAYALTVLSDLIDEDISLILLKANSVREVRDDFGTKIIVNATQIHNVSGRKTDPSFEFTTYDFNESVTVSNDANRTEKIRQGGVYIVPLVSDELGYFDLGSFDVLFEVDNKGLVHSHSSYSGLNMYDGYHISDFIVEIESFSNNLTLMQNILLSRELQKNPIIEVATLSGVKEGVESDSELIKWSSVDVVDSLGLNVVGPIDVYSYRSQEERSVKYVTQVMVGGGNIYWMPIYQEIESHFSTYNFVTNEWIQIELNSSLIKEIQQELQRFKQ